MCHRGRVRVRLRSPFMALQAPVGPPPPPPDPDKKLLASDADAWVLSCDPTTRLPFFFNRVTQASTWRVPAVLRNAAAPTDSDANRASGQQPTTIVRPPTPSAGSSTDREGGGGKKSKVGRRRSLALPIGAASAALAANVASRGGSVSASSVALRRKGGGASSPGGVGGAGGPAQSTASARFVWCVPSMTRIKVSGDGQWATQVDPSSGRDIYYNTSTRASQWEAPPGVLFFDPHVVGPAAQSEADVAELRAVTARAATAARRRAAVAAKRLDEDTGEGARGDSPGHDPDGSGEAIAPAAQPTASDVQQELRVHFGDWPPRSLAGLAITEAIVGTGDKGHKDRRKEPAVSEGPQILALSAKDRIADAERRHAAMAKRRVEARLAVDAAFRNVEAVNEEIVRKQRELEERALREVEEREQARLRAEEAERARQEALQQIARKSHGRKITKWAMKRRQSINKKKMEALRHAMQAQHKVQRQDSAARLQALYRGKKDRDRAAVLRREHLKKVQEMRRQAEMAERSKLIQAVWRGKQGRRRAKELSWKRDLRKPTRANLSKLFSIIDVSGDGKISVNEFVAAIQRTAGSIDSALSRSMPAQFGLFNRLDLDGSGEVDESEFVDALEDTSETDFLDWMQHTLVNIAEVERTSASEKKRVEGLDEKARAREARRQKRWEERLVQLFKHIDDDESGEITVRELTNSIRTANAKRIKKGSRRGRGRRSSFALGRDLHAQLSLFQSLDNDDSGKIDLSEWVEGLKDVHDRAFLQYVDYVLGPDDFDSADEGTEAGGDADDAAKAEVAEEATAAGAAAGHPADAEAASLPPVVESEADTRDD